MAKIQSGLTDGQKNKNGQLANLSEILDATARKINYYENYSKSVGKMRDNGNRHNRNRQKTDMKNEPAKTKDDNKTGRLHKKRKPDTENTRTSNSTDAAYN